MEPWKNKNNRANHVKNWIAPIQKKPSNCDAAGNDFLPVVGWFLINTNVNRKIDLRKMQSVYGFDDTKF